jgi:hypothetical protein
MGAVYPGPRNPNWRGGRSLASNGYVLVRVGVGHHLADVRGYAYEHRLVAEQKIGRRLRPGEQVHHVNRDKTDNRPENLQVEEDGAHHLYHHRRPDSELQKPGEENPQIACACGCGCLFLRFDGQGRPREYVPGHNPIPAPTVDAIRGALASGPAHRSQIATLCGLSVKAAASALSKMKRQGAAEPLGGGVWRLPEESPVPVP